MAPPGRNCTSARRKHLPASTGLDRPEIGYELMLHRKLVTRFAERARLIWCHNDGNFWKQPEQSPLNKGRQCLKSSSLPEKCLQTLYVSAYTGDILLGHLNASCKCRRVLGAPRKCRRSDSTSSASDCTIAQMVFACVAVAFDDSLSLRSFTAEESSE